MVVVVVLTCAWLHTLAAVNSQCLCVWCSSLWCVALVPCTVLFHMQVQEVFGSGTACVVCPVEKIQYLDEVLAMHPL